MKKLRQMRLIWLVVGIVLLGAVSAWAQVTNIDTTKVFTTIQAAIDDADTLAGHTLNVADGTYTITSAIGVNKGVTITGDVGNPENVLVQYAAPQSTNNGFQITTNNVMVQGIKVINGNNGFYLNGVTGCRVSNCIVSSCADKGIYVRKCPATSEATRVEVTGNIISDCGNTWGAACIQTYGSPYTYIYNNTINATEDKGINIIRSGATGTADRVQVIGNTISETKWPGIQVIGAPYTYVYNNMLTQCNYYGGDGTGDWDYASIHVQDDGATAGHNVIVDSNTVSDGINGIQTWSDDVSITNNNIYDMGTTYADTKTTGDGTYKNSGILVGSMYGDDPTGVVIAHNNIPNNYWGLFYSTDLTNGVTAENNYWGDMDPSDDVSANVDYSPWWGADYVDDDHSNPWIWGTDDSIQDAIDVASADDFVYVAAGTYYENVDLDTPGVYLWTNPGAVIDGGAVGNAVNVTVDGATIDGFEIRNGYSGIEGGDRSLLLITNNEIHDNLNIPGSAGVGILLWGDNDDNEIIGNVIYNNDRQGIFIGYSDPSKISSGNWIAGNIIHDNGLYTFANGPDESAYGIQFWCADDNVIEENEIYNHDTWWFGQGIYLYDSYGNVILGNYIHDNSYGINQWGDSVGNQVHGNSIVDNVMGIWNVDGDPSSVIDAALNWWGDVNGPAHADNPAGTGNGVSGNVIYSPWLGIGTDAEPGTVGWQPVSPMLIIVDDVGPVPLAETVLGQVINTVPGYLNRAIGAANLYLGTDTIEVRHGTYDASEPVTDGTIIMSEVGGSAIHTILNGDISLDVANIIIGIFGQGFTINGPITVGAGINASTIHINWNDIYGIVTNAGLKVLDATFNYWDTDGPDTVGRVNVYPYLPIPAADIIGYMDDYGFNAMQAITFARLLLKGLPAGWAEVAIEVEATFGISINDAMALIREYGLGSVKRALRMASTPDDFLVMLVGYVAGGGGGGFYLGGGAGGSTGMSSFCVGCSIPLQIELVHPITGEVVTDAVVSYSVCRTLPDGTTEIVMLGVMTYDDGLGAYTFEVDTTGLEPGIYDIYIGTDDGRSQHFQIEIAVF